MPTSSPSQPSPSSSGALPRTPVEEALALALESLYPLVKALRRTRLDLQYEDDRRSLDAAVDRLWQTQEYLENTLSRLENGAKGDRRATYEQARLERPAANSWG